MDFKRFFKKLGRNDNSEHCYSYVTDSFGLNFILDKEELKKVENGESTSTKLIWQHALLRSLTEQGLAEKIANGYEVLTESALEIDEEFCELFSLPPLFQGRLIAKIKGQSTQTSFEVTLSVELRNGDKITTYSIDGPFIRFSESEVYRLSKADWQAFNSVENHLTTSPEQRDEFQNNWLIFQLQLAEKAGCNIDLAHFNNIEFIKPDKVGVSIQELENGDILLTPAYGEGVKAEDIDARLGNIQGAGGHKIFRVKSKFVLLDKERMEATHEILSSRTIPKEQVKKFFEAPTAYLDGALVDLDTGFSLRVKGAEKFSHAYFGDVEKSGVQWFGSDTEVSEPKVDIKPVELPSILTDEEKIAQFEEEFADGVSTSASSIEFDGNTVDIEDVAAVRAAVKESKEKVLSQKSISEQPAERCDDTAVVAIDTNDENADFSVSEDLIDLIDFDSVSFERDVLKRTPFPHQHEGIQWLLGLLNTSIDGSEKTVPGGLLADDMGLGKTYMTLVAIAESLLKRKKAALTEKPILIVAPLSLIDNWRDEIDHTFHKSPFKDIVVLQSGADLKDYKLKGAKAETRQTIDDQSLGDVDAIRYSLKIGKVFGSDRLDLPNRLILTTYDALRDYQFSLSRIDWAVAAFDEAQNIKNPNALVSRAAKALKADFKLLATGTPVENSLKDFWCLFDTAVPGLLDSWQAFRELYIAPILNASPEDTVERKVEVGKKLRDVVGKHMLRRVKEDQLEGLPSKFIWSGDNSVTSSHVGYLKTLSDYMVGIQKQHYDDIIESVSAANSKDKQKVVLASLHKLREISIHPSIDNTNLYSLSKSEVKDSLEQSAKMKSLMLTLGEIRKRGEKVIIFAITKKLQTYLSVVLGLTYGQDIAVINGDTKAVKSKAADRTRKSIIKDFESAPGFSIIIMSPIAAGVGLTIVGANNVIHLERHWNPAKEAQATDRVYRIGQTKDVNVYIPMSLHGDLPSFDVSLNALLSKKVDLSQAVVTPEEVKPEDLSGMFGGK